MIEIEGPDGVIYEFPEGTDQQTMASAMAKVYGAPQQSPEMSAGLSQLSALSQPEYQNSVAGIAGQVGSGSQEGIAGMLGLPVDAVAGGISGLGGLTGLWGPIENPVGGSQFFSDVMAPTRAGVAEPRTDAERFARRTGEEIGATAAGLPVALGSAVGRASPVAAALVEGASGLGSGLGAATANYVAPDSLTAEIAGVLLGGVPAGMIASRATGLSGTDAVMSEGTLESQRQRARDAYGVVEADTGILGAQGATDLEMGIIQRAIDADIDPMLTPGAYGAERAVAGRINPNMTVGDIEKLRRIVGDSISPTASPADKRVSMAIKNEITDYLDSINSPATDALREGRDATRRTRAAEMVMGATDKAERRAASSGSGGNEINAIRQNIRSMLDNPNRAKSFTAAERSAMEEIVRGSTDQNLMRRLSRFAPSSGGLASMLGIGGALANPAIALPIVGITEGAKIAGERSTQKSIDALVRSLLGERVMKTSEQGINPVVAALLGLRATEQGSN